MRSVDIDELGALLNRADARLTAWQVHALYLGVQASTSFRLGLHRLLEHIFGEDMVLGESIDEANEYLGLLNGYWNTLLTDKAEGHLRLSQLPVSEPPTAEELHDLAQRRTEEVTWFVRGIDAGGDDPIEFGEEGQAILLHRLAGGPPSARTSASCSRRSRKRARRSSRRPRRTSKGSPTPSSRRCSRSRA